MQKLVAETPNHLLTDLAGNAVSLPVTLALVMSTISALDWRPQNDAPEDSDVVAALEAFNTLASGRAKETNNAQQKLEV